MDCIQGLTIWKDSRSNSSHAKLKFSLSFECWVELYCQGGGIMEFELGLSIDGWSKVSLLGRRLVRISLGFWIIVWNFRLKELGLGCAGSWNFLAFGIWVLCFGISTLWLLELLCLLMSMSSVHHRATLSSCVPVLLGVNFLGYFTCWCPVHLFQGLWPLCCHRFLWAYLCVKQFGASLWLGA